MTESPWNSLEMVKITASLITPILVLVLGIVINNSIKNSERSTSLRSEIYTKIGGDLNDIYSYLAFVGAWKEITPLEIMSKKRAVDKAIYTYKPFFSDELFATYNKFMDEAFKPFGEAGTDAKIRSDIKTGDGDRAVHSKGWKKEWESRFTKERNKQEQREAYNDFLEQLVRDLKL